MPQTEEKTITLPDPDEMMRRLVGVLDEPHAKENLFPAIVEWAAGREVVADGVVMSVLLPMEEYVQGLPPVARGPIRMFLPRFVEALVDDEEVRLAALGFIEEANKKAQEERDAQPPAPPRTKLTDDEATELYANIRHLCEVFDEVLGRAPSKSTMNWRNEGPNPFYNQTVSGLYIEFYYGQPTKVWTPWGEWHFADPNEHIDVEALMARLTTSVHMEERHESYGTIGPVYALNAIGDTQLPDPSLPSDRRQYLEYEEAKEAWERLTEAWYEANNLEMPMSSQEKWDLDQAIIKTRSESEPKPPQKGDITSVKQLTKLQGQVVKYTRDGGETWEYTKLSNSAPETFSDGSFGISANTEVLPNTESHSMYALTDKDFAKGMVVRATKPEEVQGMKFSYEH